MFSGLRLIHRDAVSWVFNVFQLFKTSSANAVASFLDPLLVLIEYVPYGDLLGYLRKSRGLSDTYYKDPDLKKPQTSLTADKLLQFAWQIADGMSYLSSKKVYLHIPKIFEDLIGYTIFTTSEKHRIGFLIGRMAFVTSEESRIW